MWTRDMFAQQNPQMLPALMLDYCFAVQIMQILLYNQRMCPYLTILVSVPTPLETGYYPHLKIKISSHIYIFCLHGDICLYNEMFFIFRTGSVQNTNYKN